MSYFYTLVEKQSPKIPREHVNEVVKILYRAGYISDTLERHYNIFLSYKERVRECEENNYPKKVALVDTMKEHNIGRSQLFSIVKFFESPEDAGLE